MSGRSQRTTSGLVAACVAAVTPLVLAAPPPCEDQLGREFCSDSEFIYVDRVLIEGSSVPNIQTVSVGDPQVLVSVEPAFVGVWAWGQDPWIRDGVAATCAAVCSVEAHALPGCKNTQAIISLEFAPYADAWLGYPPPSEFQKITGSERTAEVNDDVSPIEEISTTATVQIFPKGWTTFGPTFECNATAAVADGDLGCTKVEMHQASLSVTCVVPLTPYKHRPPLPGEG